MSKDEIKKALECCSNPNIGSCKDCPYNYNDEFHCAYGEMCKDALNLINEQETEIEQLKAENEKMRKERGYINQLKEELLLKHYHVDCYQEEIKKQAKIDVLNELKTRHDYAIKNMGYPWDISQQIDKLIKEIEKGGESDRHDRHFTPNDNKLEIIVIKDLQEVEK